MSNRLIIQITNQSINRQNAALSTFVSPGIGATFTTFFAFSVLMMELLPTFGYPINPTEICFLSTCSLPNWRRMLISGPLPKELVMEAWKARVGYSALSMATHFFVTHVGTRSHLFRMKTRCLKGASSLRNFSITGHRVPMGSRASRTCKRTSAESITYKERKRSTYGQDDLVK